MRAIPMVAAAVAVLSIMRIVGGQSPPAAIAGQVVDAATHKPIQDAWVTSQEEVTRTDGEGRFVLHKKAKAVGARASGYARTTSIASGNMLFSLPPLQIRGVYLSFFGVSSAVLRDGVFEAARQAHLNAVVVDIKGDRGWISYPTHVKMALDAGANHSITIPNPTAFTSDLHKRGLYAIARIVTFKDNPFAHLRPDLAVKTTDGRLFVDREGFSWTDPSQKAVWEYNIAIAVEAAQEGFDEIEFDYVRFPDQKGLVFSKPNSEANRRQAIADFLGEARKRLVLYNVFLSADDFGYTCWNEGDTGIGQCLADLGPVVDYISPMLYPSSFQYGIPGLRNPLSDPYRIVFASLEKAKERTKFPAITFRPWLQAFNDYAFDKRKFGKAELKAQIKAAQDAGSDGWLLWDPRNRYPTAVLEELSRELGWARP